MDFPSIYFRRLRSVIALLAVAMTLFVACDVLEDDVSPDNPTVNITGKEVYALTGNSAYIDLRSMVKTAESIRLTITAQPTRGTLSDLQQGLLRYTPNSSFKNGRDNFQFAVYSTDNKLLLQDTVVIIVTPDSTNLPCGLYPVNDLAYATANVPVTVPVLNNDILCSDSTNIKLEIYHPASGFPPFKGTAEVVSNRYIRYAPSASFQGADSVIYKVTSLTDTTKVGYGVLLIVAAGTSTPPPPTCEWTLVNDFFTIDRTLQHDTVFLPIFQNDTLCSNLMSKYTVSIVNGPYHGAVQLNGLSAPRYGITLPDTTSVTTLDSLVYRICADTTCKQAKVVIKINP